MHLGSIHNAIGKAWPMFILTYMVDFLQKWNLIQFEPPQLLQRTEFRSSIYDIDTVRAKIYAATRDADTFGNEFIASLQFWKKPDQVRTGSIQIPKGKLVLFPAVNLNSIGTKPTATCVSFGNFQVGGKKTAFYANLPPKAKEDDEDGTFCAYCWVSNTFVKEAVNMDVHHVTSNGVKIPVLRNSRMLAPYEKLCIYKEAPAPAGTTLCGSGSASSAKPPAKKPRKSS